MIALKSIGKCEGGFWGNVGKGKVLRFGVEIIYFLSDILRSLFGFCLNILA